MKEQESIVWCYLNKISFLKKKKGLKKINDFKSKLVFETCQRYSSNSDVLGLSHIMTILAYLAFCLVTTLSRETHHSLSSSGRPGEELHIFYSIWYAGLSGDIVRRFTPKDEEGGPGCLVEEEMTISTPWVSSHYVLYHSKATHPDSLYHMKLTIESMHEYFNERKEWWSEMVGTKKVDMSDCVVWCGLDVTGVLLPTISWSTQGGTREWSQPGTPSTADLGNHLMSIAQETPRLQ